MKTRIIAAVLATALLLTACDPSAPVPTATPPPIDTPLPPTDTPPVPTDTPIPSPTPHPAGWVVLETTNYPSPRAGHTMAMLPDGSVLLFGGRDADGNVLGDTWIFGSEASASVSPEDGVRLALRTSRGWLLGTGAAALSTILSRPKPNSDPAPDVWSPMTSPNSSTRYTHQGPDAWNPMHPANSPSARFGHSMVTLPDGQIVFFGGINDVGECFNDLASFERTDWTPITPTNRPPPGRHHHTAWAYDVYMYVASGITCGNPPTGFDDMWRYDLLGNTWEQLPNPPASFSPNVYPIIHDDRAYFLDMELYASTVYFYDMRENTWGSTELTGERPLVSKSMWAQVGTQAYLMGGANWDRNTQTSILTGEVWRLDLDTWAWTRLEDMPSLACNGEAVYDPYHERIITYGMLEQQFGMEPGYLGYGYTCILWLDQSEP